MIASLAATALAFGVVVANFLFGVSDAAFQTPFFHFAALAVIVATVLAAKLLAYRAFVAALAKRQIVMAGPELPRLMLSGASTPRALVMLHLRLARLSLHA